MSGRCSTCEEPYFVRSPGCEEHTEWQLEVGDARCPECGRAECTGENCCWPDEAGLR